MPVQSSSKQKSDRHQHYYVKKYLACKKPLQPLYTAIFKGHRLRRSVTEAEVHHRVSLSSCS